MDNGLVIKKGDSLKVFQKITEGKKERIVTFKGNVVSVKGSGENTMFTVRQILDGVTVDRIYPLYAPSLSKIEKVEEKKKSPRKKSSKPHAKAKSKKKAA